MRTRANGSLLFEWDGDRASSIASADLHALLQTIVTRLMKLLTHRGVLVEDMGQTHLAGPDADRDEARTSGAQSSS